MRKNWKSRRRTIRYFVLDIEGSTSWLQVIEIVDKRLTRKRKSVGPRKVGAYPAVKCSSGTQILLKLSWSSVSCLHVRKGDPVACRQTSKMVKAARVRCCFWRSQVAFSKACAPYPSRKVYPAATAPPESQAASSTYQSQKVGHEQPSPAPTATAVGWAQYLRRMQKGCGGASGASCRTIGGLWR